MNMETIGLTPIGDGESVGSQRGDSRGADIAFGGGYVTEKQLDAAGKILGDEKGVIPKRVSPLDEQVDTTPGEPIPEEEMVEIPD